MSSTLSARTESSKTKSGDIISKPEPRHGNLLSTDMRFLLVSCSRAACVHVRVSDTTGQYADVTCVMFKSREPRCVKIFPSDPDEFLDSGDVDTMCVCVSV